MKNIYLFSNGCMAVFDVAGNQMPELQIAYMRLILKWLIEHNQDPLDFTIKMPDGLLCKFFKVEDGYNWKGV